MDRTRRCLPATLVLALGLALPASAGWRATTPQAEAASKTPRIAAALEATAAIDRAILAGDADAFGALFTDDAVVNNPASRVVRKADAVEYLRNGTIRYAALDRVIEYAAERNGHDVVLMGEEHFTPAGGAAAGRPLRRRITEVWTDAGGRWQLSVRQATIQAAE